MNLILNMIHFMDDFTLNEYKINILSVTMDFLIKQYENRSNNEFDTIHLFNEISKNSGRNTLSNLCTTSIADLIFIVEKKQGITKHFFHPIFSYFNQFEWDPFQLIVDLYISIFAKYSHSNSNLNKLMKLPLQKHYIS